MSVLKGYTSKIRQSLGTIISDLFATFQPIRRMQVGMDVIAHGWIRTVGTDAVEATSTASVIKATGHAAQVGDVINFTSGNLDGHEVKVIKVEANLIYLGEELSEVPGTGDTFEIERHKYPKVNDDGDLNVSVTSTGVIAFLKNAVATQVTEDTVTPANNRPLPVKLMGVNGSLSLTSDVLDISSTKETDSIEIFNGEDVKFIHRHDYAVNVTTAAYTQLIAATSAAIRKMQIFDSSGQTLVIATGAAASEVNKLYVIPGGNGQIEVQIPAGTRISVKAISANATTGELTINFIG